HYIPYALPAGKTLTRNVRLCNTGPSVVSSRGCNPALLAYHWHERSGRLVSFEGERTFLPIGLLPGQALTVPALIRRPTQPGEYRLELTMVHEGVAWLDRDAVEVNVDVIENMGAMVPAHWTQTDKPAETYDYQEDHRLGQQIVFGEIGRNQRPGMRILEVGGCCNPMMRGLPYEIYCVDIDIHAVKVGQLWVAGRPEALQFVAADVHALPFADGSFDAVVMFSALHHFAKPVEVLRRLTELLRRDGFLAVMCEPVGHYLNGQVGPDFLRELEQGINEQIFTLEEYHEMFVKAGLSASFAQADRGSFKAILCPEPIRSAHEDWWQQGKAVRERDTLQVA